MIDWYIIQYLYPESFKRFVEDTFPNIGVISLCCLSFYDVKKLYWFFKKNGITMNVELINKDKFIYVISLNCGVTIVPSQISKNSKIEMEIDGFFDCFRRLDIKLRESIDEKYL